MRTRFRPIDQSDGSVASIFDDVVHGIADVASAAAAGLDAAGLPEVGAPVGQIATAAVQTALGLVVETQGGPQ